MTAIDDLRRKVQNLEDQLSDARKKLSAAELDACPIKVGMIVIGNDGKEYRVAEVDLRWETPWLIGNPKRADGSFGNGRRSLYDRYQVKP